MSVRLQLKVIPKASKNEIAGWIGDALKVRVTAPPERGKANEAVLKTVAFVLRLPRENVRLVSGETHARKVIEVEGLSETELHARLYRYFSPRPPSRDPD